MPMLWSDPLNLSVGGGCSACVMRGRAGHMSTPLKVGLQQEQRSFNPPLPDWAGQAQSTTRPRFHTVPSLCPAPPPSNPANHARTMPYSLVGQCFHFLRGIPSPLWSPLGIMMWTGLSSDSMALHQRTQKWKTLDKGDQIVPLSSRISPRGV